MSYFENYDIHKFACVHYYFQVLTGASLEGSISGGPIPTTSYTHR